MANKKHKPVPKNLHDHHALKHLIFKMLQGDHFWHGRIKHILAAAGIATRRIERMESHPIWLIWLTLTAFDLSHDTKTANKQLRKVLAQGGIKIVRKHFDIIYRRGDKLRCVFVLDLGAPGVA